MNAQRTVGLLSYDPSQAFEGYNLVFPHNQPNVYLLDNCGEIVHMWEDSANFRPGNIAYIWPDGTLLKGKRDASVVNDAIWAGGGGAIVEVRDWDNTLIWSYELNDSTKRFHHDFVPMPNGNVLAIAWELKTYEESIQAGRDTATMAQDKLWPDYILELNPSNSDIVWEWHAWDHLIQDHDSTKDNYGVVADHPELIDLNYDRNNGHPDWMHANALDYNEELDQIMLCVPYFDEIWVIDHSTTTAQAAGHTGGAAARGGDLLYRWGNPATYRAGDSSDQTLFFPHDAHWSNDFLTAAHPDFNKIAVFNNRVGADYSTANIFNPPWEMYSWTYTMDTDMYGPTSFDETYQHPVDPTNLYSTGLSSIQQLPNNNVLITSGRYGYTFELTPNNEIVWEYVTPLIGGNPASQGDTLTINQNLTFRMKRYPADYAAFMGRTLTPQGWIELNPDTAYCNSVISSNDREIEYFLDVYPNPAQDNIIIEWEKGGPVVNIQVFDLTGRVITECTATGGRKYLDVSDWQNGLYIIQIEGSDTKRILVQK